MRIREWEYGDVSEIAGLLGELNQALGEDQLIDEKNIEEHFREMKKYPELYRNYICEQDGRIVGFMSLLFYRSVYHQVGTTLINELIVSKACRGQGIGKQLIAFCKELSKQRRMDEIEVGVMKDNQRAIDFYKANGLVDEYFILGMELPPD